MKIEEQYKENKKNKNEVPIVEFRKECRTFAEKWIEIHKEQFKRLGVVGDWENYYSTMSYDAEAQIVRELGKFLKEGSLYRGFKPVLWSTVEKTALADAEVEYQDHKSDTIYACFPVKSSKIKESFDPGPPQDESLNQKPQLWNSILALIYLRISEKVAIKNLRFWYRF